MPAAYNYLRPRAPFWFPTTSNLLKGFQGVKEKSSLRSLFNESAHTAVYTQLCQKLIYPRFFAK